MFELASLIPVRVCPIATRRTTPRLSNTTKQQGLAAATILHWACPANGLEEVEKDD